MTSLAEPRGPESNQVRVLVPDARERRQRHRRIRRWTRRTLRDVRRNTKEAVPDEAGRPGQITPADQSCSSGSRPSDARSRLSRSQLSSSRPLRPGRPAGPLRDGFASLDPAATPMDLGDCDRDEEDQQPEPQP
jgi:hypothetical protein